MKLGSTLGLLRFLLTPIGKVGLLVLALAVCAGPGLAQDESHNENTPLKIKIERLESSLSRLERELKEQKTEHKSRLDSLKSQIEEVNEKTGRNVAAIDEKVGEQQKTVTEDLTSLGTRVESELKSNLTYLLIAVASLIGLLVGAVMFFRSKSNHSRVHIEETRKSLEERWLQTDSRLVELLEKELSGTISHDVEGAGPSPDSGERDHSLQLKVADEIVRIHNYLSFLDPNAKGVKHLAASVKRIEDNLEAEGYEIPKMLNKPYDQGMKVVANFKVDETLGPDEYIITRIIKPAVNYRGVMIQAAEIEVSHGE